MQCCMQHDVVADAYYAEHDEKLMLNAVIWFSSHDKHYSAIKQMKLRLELMRLASGLLISKIHVFMNCEKCYKIYKCKKVI